MNRTSLHSQLGLMIAIVIWVCVAAAVVPPGAQAKRVVDYFGNDPSIGFGSLGGEFSQFGRGGIAVNQTGAGPADAGDIYVVDAGVNRARVQRFHHDEGGTPADPYDDEYPFVAAWGADVVQTGGVGDKGDALDAEYEICTVAEQCRPGIAVGGNGSVAGNGALNDPSGIAIDQDTGNVYVADAGNARVNVYAGDGTFLRSFGWDVVAAGPGKESALSEAQQLTVKADGGKFSLSFRGATTGGRGIGRVRPGDVVDLKLTSGAFEVGQAFSAFFSGPSLYPLGTTITSIEGGVITTSKPAKNNQSNAQLFGDDIPFDVTAAELEGELNGLPTIGGVGGSVTVSGGPGDASGSAPFTIEFGGTLAGDDVPALEGSSRGLMLGAGAGEAIVNTSVNGGAYEVCVAADGDVCQAGNYGQGLGQTNSPLPSFSLVGMAVSPPDGDPATGTVYGADPGNRRINSYALDGSGPANFGSSAQFGSESPAGVAVDSRGIVYAVDRSDGGKIERYDADDANGGGAGFLAPILAGTNEVQKVAVSATAGTFNLTFEGETTVDLPFDAPGGPGSGGDPGPAIDSVDEALAALPSIGPHNVEVSGANGNYTVNFRGGLGAKDVPEVSAADGSPPLSGGTGISVTTTKPGQPGLLRGDQVTSAALVVDPDADGGGPDADVLYALRPRTVQQFGPVNAPGLVTPPSDDDARHAGGQLGSQTQGVALDESSGHLYASAGEGVGQKAQGVYVLHDAGGAPTASVDSVSDIGTTSATVNATVNPNGGPTVSYRIEYSTDGNSWRALPDTVLGSQQTPQVLSVPLDPPGTGLEPGTLHHVRLVATKRFAATAATAPLSFTTLAAPPAAETVGAPLRTATTAQLAGRVNSRGASTTFHFEYGTAPCDANPCMQTAAQPTGAADETQLVGARIGGLVPNTTYHYRVVADNGNPGSPVAGEDLTVLTRASDKGLSHGAFPGPPGSDRAWEQVSMDDSNGNPVVYTISTGFSTDGNRAIYGMGGGNPFSDNASAFSQYFAERTGTDWETRIINPPRGQLNGVNWSPLVGAEDLSELYGPNFGLDAMSFFNLSPDHSPHKLYEVNNSSYAGAYTASDDGSRVLVLLKGAPDPAYPEVGGNNLYDITAAGADLVSVLPGEAASSCGTAPISESSPTVRTKRWLSPDGRLLFFPSEGPDCNGTTRIYLRDLGTAETKLISGPAISGQECDAAFLKWTPGAAFVLTASRLVMEDSNPSSCDSGDRDVYRYDLQEESLDCLTCLAPGLDADVKAEVANQLESTVAVAADGSRIYFTSPNRLLPGTSPNGTYRVDVASGELAYIGKLEATIGESADAGQAMNADGSVLVFYSKADFLNPLGEGHDNGGTGQYYRYDDRDRSLLCISCPSDGSAPRDEAPNRLNAATLFKAGAPNVNFVSDDGAVVFRTPEALASADQNTPPPSEDPVAGMDIYEWRDGRLLLVSDGLSSWPAGPQTPELLAMTPSGRDVFFVAPAQLTPDAIDGYFRLYDARVGGGFEFPQPPTTCPLEVCQGTPKGAPQRPSPGSASFSGRGNPVSAKRTACRKGKVRRKGRCLNRKAKKRAAKKKRRANRNRRASR